MRVEADASDYVTGGILSVKEMDRKWRPVAFISKIVESSRKELRDS